MIDENVRRQVDAVHTRYIRVIDEDRIEEWPGLFTEVCLYRIITRENIALRDEIRNAGSG